MFLQLVVRFYKELSVAYVAHSSTILALSALGWKPLKTIYLIHPEDRRIIFNKTDHFFQQILKTHPKPQWSYASFERIEEVYKKKLLLEQANSSRHTTSPIQFPNNMAGNANQYLAMNPDAPDNGVKDKTYGVATNRAYLAKWLVAEELYGKLCIFNVNHGILNGSFTGKNICQMVQLISRVRFFTKHNTRKNVQAEILAMAELHGGLLPEEHYLNEANSQAEIIAVAKALAKEETCASLGLEITPFGYLNGDDFVAHTEAALTLDQAIRYIFACTQANLSALAGPINTLVCTIISYCKRGIVSDEFLIKIADGMKDDIAGSIIRLNRDVISTFYRVYGRYINPNNAKQLFDHWKSIVPENCIRLSVTIQQSCGSGLTQLMTIHRAIVAHDDFPWHKIAANLPVEWSLYMAATEAVGSNLYYGFAQDLGVAKASGYKSIGWVAKELLVHLEGDRALNNYQGWARGPANSGIIKKIVDDYLKDNADKAVLEQDEVGKAHTRAFVTTVKGYFAGMQGANPAADPANAAGPAQ